MNISELAYLEKCKKLIEDKLGWGDACHWKEREFKYLSKLIFEETRILLSISTLKRIWKKKVRNTPHPSTLNALAQFIHHEDWYHFRKEISGAVRHEPGETDDKHQRSRAALQEPLLSFRHINTYKKFFNQYRFLFIGVIFSLSIVLIIFKIHPLPISSNQYDSIIFTSKKVVTSGVPNTVIFHYDISSIKEDSVTIQQTWDPRRIDRITKENHYNTSIYYYPGFHKAKLKVNDQVIKEHHIHITTDGWLPTVRYTWNDPIPIYLPKDRLIHQGRMYISPEILRTSNVNLSENQYLVSYFNVRDFGNLNGDNFRIETRIKNDLNEGGLIGQYGMVFIYCTEGRIGVPLCIPGCVSNISLKTLDGWMYGKDNDLSAFGCDMSNWNDLQYEAKNRSVNIKLNGRLIYQLTHKKPAGRVIGLHYIFSGCGSVDHVRLYDHTNTVVFDDQFLD
jgi:hypothetical protein